MNENEQAEAELCFVTKHNSLEKRRGRPISPAGMLRRELGISRLDAWKMVRLTEIPQEQYDVLLAKHHTNWGVLRAAGKLSPERPRPHVRAAAEAIEHLEQADQLLRHLCRLLLETGSDEELGTARGAALEVVYALGALRWKKNR